MKSLTGMGGVGNARELAEMLRQMGRGRDTILAHITPEEAQMLMDAGGSGDGGGLSVGRGLIFGLALSKHSTSPP